MIATPKNDYEVLRILDYNKGLSFSNGSMTVYIMLKMYQQNKKSLIKRLLCLAIFSFCFSFMKAQNIIIHTKNTSLVYHVNNDKQLEQVYFGKRFSDTSNYADLSGSNNPAFPGGGMHYIYEPAMEVAHADGNISLQLNYVDNNIEQQDDHVTVTNIKLKDPVYPFSVTLHFKAYASENVIEEWTTIEHEEKSSVTLLRYASSFINLDYKDFYLTHFYGDWASEMQYEETHLPEGIYNIQSKLGTRATNYEIPSFMVSLNKPAEENTGEVFAGSLAWSGNFNLQFENIKSNGHQGNSLKLIPGINAYASSYTLQPKEPFNTPHFIFTFSSTGKGQASRNLHEWALNYGIWKGRQTRQTLLNNWEATYFNFNQDTLVQLFDGAKKLGVDLFLLDDGWFGNNHPRHSDTAGLGDWQANRTILPDGVEYLVKQAENKGVHFGIWVEPEMVNPKSDLYEKHPDWILKLPNRPEDLSRNQLVLDLTNPKVQDFVYGVLLNLLTGNPGIAYIKWDCNRFMTNAYSKYLGKNQQALYVDYSRGLYNVLQHIRKEFPSLEMMLCSGGGGRAEYGALQYFNEFWPSDNTDAVERIFIQWGYSYFFPAATMCDHVTSAGAESLKYKIDVAMQGKLGFDIKVNDLSEEELKFCRMAVDDYKRLQSLINYGSLYRLISPYNNSTASLMYVDSSKEKAIVFAYNLYAKRGDTYRNIMMEGLDASRKYMLKEINIENGKEGAFRESGKFFSGEYLMKEGLNWYLDGSLASSVLELTAQ
ncbi:MAG: alpha-galactosidase [Ginsengibacter sp.]